MQPSDLVLTPETRLVLATAGGARSPALEVVPRSGIRWDAVVQVAMHERGVSGVWGVLNEYPGIQLPTEAAAALERLALGSRVRMTWLAHRLDETLRALAAAGVPVVLLKGAALGHSAYRSLAERHMGDLDLLVPANRAAEARTAALATGWGPSGREVEEDFYAGHHHLPPLRDLRSADLQLEIHTGLFPCGHPYQLEAADIWQAAQFNPTAGASIPTPVDQVLHIAIHFAWAHMMTQGAWQAFRDLGQIASQPGFEWDSVVQGARRAGAPNAMYWTLALARAAGGTPVPADVLASLRPRRSRRRLRTLGRHLGMLMDPLADPCPSYTLSHRLWTSAMQDDIAGREVVMPWARDGLNFVVVRRPDPSSRHWLARHVRDAGRYFRYVRLLARGSS